MIFKGNCTAMITPFKNGKVNFEMLEKLLDRQIQSKSAVLMLGTTGETPTLFENEKIELVKFAKNFLKDKVPLVVGAGSNSTQIAVEKTKLFADLGADAILSVTPYYNKATQKGLKKHFLTIAEKTNVPIIIYNVPGRTGVNILPKTVKEISQNKHIVGIKEASGNIEQIAEIIRICDKDFCVYSGDDSLTFPCVCLGGMGVVSVLGNLFPQQVQNLCSYLFENKLEQAKKLNEELLPLAKAMFLEVNPIPVKAALKFLGFDVGGLRLPLTNISQKNKNKLIKLLKK